MKIFIFFTGILLLLQSCKSTSKTQSMPPYYFADLLDKDTDTTFSYRIANWYTQGKSLSYILPDSLGGNKVTGRVDFYSMINDKKEIESIEILELSLRKNGKKFIHYWKGHDTKVSSKLYYKKFKQYLYEKVKTLPFKQTKPVSQKLHPSYCIINLSEF